MVFLPVLISDTSVQDVPLKVSASAGRFVPPAHTADVEVPPPHVIKPTSFKSPVSVQDVPS